MPAYILKHFDRGLIRFSAEDTGRYLMALLQSTEVLA